MLLLDLDLDLVLLNHWVDVLVEKDGVHKELTEDLCSEELLEFSRGQVELEGGGGQELSENRKSEVLLEFRDGVQLTESVKNGGNVVLLVEWQVTGWDDRLDQIPENSGGQLLLVVNVVEHTGELMFHLSLYLWVHLTVLDVVEYISVYPRCHLSAHSGYQQNCNKSLHDEMKMTHGRNQKLNC